MCSLCARVSKIYMATPAIDMVEPAQILVVEDEEAIRDMLSVSLQRNGHQVIAVAKVAAAKKVLSETKIDIALVDWMLPGGNGLEFVRFLRASQRTRNMPVIMLTARTGEEDVTAGLDAGADDYVTKPFSPKELNSRINALLRRIRDRPATDSTLVAGPLQLDIHTHKAHCMVNRSALALELGHTEYKLLRFFMENPERVFSRGQLLDNVWGSDTFIEERTVDVHMLRLRKILKPAGIDSMLETVRGAGYRLSAKVPP